VVTFGPAPRCPRLRSLQADHLAPARGRCFTPGVLDETLPRTFGVSQGSLFMRVACLCHQQPDNGRCSGLLHRRMTVTHERLWSVRPPPKRERNKIRRARWQFIWRLRRGSRFFVGPIPGVDLPGPSCARPLTWGCCGAFSFQAIGAVAHLPIQNIGVRE